MFLLNVAKVIRFEEQKKQKQNKKKKENTSNKRNHNNLKHYQNRRKSWFPSKDRRSAPKLDEAVNHIQGHVEAVELTPEWDQLATVFQLQPSFDLEHWVAVWKNQQTSFTVP